MKSEELVRAVEDAALDGNGGKKLACEDAFKLAARHGVSRREIGRVCNRRKIRICKCQLGCFA